MAECFTLSLRSSLLCFSLVGRDQCRALHLISCCKSSQPRSFAAPCSAPSTASSPSRLRCRSACCVRNPPTHNSPSLPLHLTPQLTGQQLPAGWEWLPDPEVSLFAASNLPRLDMNFHFAPDATLDSGGWFYSVGLRRGAYGMGSPGVRLKYGPGQAPAGAVLLRRCRCVVGRPAVSPMHRHACPPCRLRRGSVRLRPTKPQRRLLPARGGPRSLTAR